MIRVSRQPIPPPSAGDFLAGLGIRVSQDGGIEIDWRQATDYIHHSRLSVAIVATAAADPYRTRRLFPKWRLTDLVGKRPAMDGREARALAALGGVELSHGLFANYEMLRTAFASHLEDVLDQYDLHPCFLRDPDGKGHESIRPLGYSRLEDRVEEDRGLEAFKSAARAMTEAQRIMVATVICLYRGDAARDSRWLKGRSWAWHAADAIAILRQNRSVPVFSDWCRLVALYPGW
jgi:hypothetical protein